MVKFPFFAAHVPGGNDSEQRASNGEDDGENPVFIGPAKCRIPSHGFGAGIGV
jgi:hypothetical protein